MNISSCRSHYSYAYDCSSISRKYGKNRSASDIKSHHWIISFDPKDVVERGLTVEKAHQLGMEFATKRFGGFHCIVATHQDGNNGSGNIQNLKENARRFAFMTENGLLNVDRLATELSRTRKAFYQKQSQQVAVEKRLKEVNGILQDVAAFYETNKVYNQYINIKNPRKQKQFYAQHEREILLNKASNSRILQYRKAHNLATPPSFPALKKEKAALLKEQERLNTERKALKESLQGMSDAYRAIDEQMRQVQRQRQRGTVQRRDEFSL